MDLQPLVSKKHFSGRSRPPQKRKTIHFDPDSPVPPFWQDKVTLIPTIQHFIAKPGKHPTCQKSWMPKLLKAQLKNSQPIHQKITWSSYLIGMDRSDQKDGNQSLIMNWMQKSRSSDRPNNRRSITEAFHFDCFRNPLPVFKACKSRKANCPRGRPAKRPWEGVSCMKMG